MSTVVDRARILRVKTELYEIGHVLIEVGDSGTGIDPENINRVFEAFFTTKSHGMGMGLSICRASGRPPVSPRDRSFTCCCPPGAARCGTIKMEMTARRDRGPSARRPLCIPRTPST